MIEESIFQPVNNFEYPDLPNIDLNSSLDSNNLIYNYSELLKDKTEEKYNKDLKDWINSHNEDLGNDLDNLFYPETNNQTYKFKQSKGYNAVKPVMDKLVTDSTKKNILLKIAEKESNFNSNAKNPKSSASGLFGFIDSTKQRFGYGKSIEEQIIGASKLYDSMYSQLSYYVNKYGTKNKSLEQLMYGMWFRPKSLLNYLKTGYDSYTDAQGTGLNKIFTKMAQKGMKFQNKVDTIEKSVTQYLGYNPNTKFGKVQAAYNQVNSFNRKQPNLTNNNMNTVKNYNTRQAAIIDKKDNPNIVAYKTLAPYKEMSGTDPIGQFVIESVGLGKIFSAIAKTKFLKNFKSELDWDPVSWFKQQRNLHYTNKDIKILQSHIPEYLKIEKLAKKNGTWLKTQDGKPWQGDPRTWVQLMSKNGQKLKQHQYPTNRDILYSGIDKEVNPDYDGVLWTVSPNKTESGGFAARTYTNSDNKVLQFGIPNYLNKNQYVINAKGKPWSYIKGKTTNDIVKQQFNNNKYIIRINNVRDKGGSGIPETSKYYVSRINTERYFSPQNDVIIAPKIPRKSLLGNNGNFDLNNKNIFRSIVPIIGGYYYDK